MLMRKMFSTLFLLSLFISSMAQYTGVINLVTTTPKNYYVASKFDVVISSVTSPGDTLKIVYPSSKVVSPVNTTTEKALSTTIKKYVTGSGTKTAPYKITLQNFGGLGCPHFEFQSFTIKPVFNGTDSVLNVVWASGMNSMLMDRMSDEKEGQRINDSLFQEAVKRGKENGYQAIGKITKEIWNVPGSSLAAMDWSLKPDSLFELASPIQVSDAIRQAHATRFRGYLFPPTPGNYTFWVSADDAATLYLSTDSSPQNKRVVAYNSEVTRVGEWEKLASQKSADIFLDATKKYYIELIHKDGGGGSRISLRWKWPSPFDKIEYPIPLIYFSPIKN